MDTPNLPPYPMAPFSQDSGTSSAPSQNSFGINSTQSEIQRYISEFHAAVIPRVRAIEQNQENFKAIISKEEKLVDSSQKLFYLSITLGISSCIICLFILLIVYFDFNGIIILHIKDITTYIPFMFLFVVFGFIKPIIYLHSFVNRMDSLENRISNIENKTIQTK